MLILYLSVCAITLVAVTYFYRRGQYVTTAPGKIAWLPKYRVKITLPREAFEVRRPYMVLDEILAAYGFSRSDGDRMPLVYMRGSIFGDFLVDRTGLKLEFDESQHYGYTRECMVTLEAAWLILFDTGDLWQLLQSIKASIEFPMQPLWRPGQVDSNCPHIRIKEADSGKILARVAPDGQYFNVDCIDQGSDASMKVLHEQLDFYLGSKQEDDPWKYVIYHCSTSANLYSPVRWSYKDTD